MQGTPEDQWNRNERHPGNVRREQHHRGAHHNHGGDQLQDLVGAMVEEALQLVDVVVQHRHQPATAAQLKKAHLQLLEVVVGLKSQLVLQPLGQVAPEQPLQVFEARLGAPDHKGEHRQQPQLAGHGGGAKAGQPGGVLLDHHIHRQADQHRRRQIEELVQNRAARRQNQPEAIGPQGFDQPAQGWARGQGAYQRLPPPP